MIANAIQRQITYKEWRGIEKPHHAEVDAADDDSKITTTARLVVSLDVILFELTAMEEAVRNAANSAVADADRRTLRAEIDALWKRADALMSWLSAQRVESPKN